MLTYLLRPSIDCFMFVLQPTNVIWIHSLCTLLCLDDARLCVIRDVLKHERGLRSDQQPLWR